MNFKKVGKVIIKKGGIKKKIYKEKNNKGINYLFHLILNIHYLKDPTQYLGLMVRVSLCYIMGVWKFCHNLITEGKKMKEYQTQHHQL